jgi:hypothetical protein
MANPPPPYDNITGISRAVMKDNAQETLPNYNGNARPGELVVNLTVNPPTVYIGNNAGSLTLVASGNSASFTETVYVGGNASGNVTPNLINGSIQKYTLTGNIALLPVSNISAGQSITLILTQDGTGNRILDANIAYLFASGFQTLSTDSNAIDVMNIFYDGTTYYATLTVSYS